MPQPFRVIARLVPSLRAAARRGLAILLSALIVTAAGLGAALAQGAPAPAAAARDAAEVIKLELDQIEAAFSRPLNADALNEVRRTVDPLRERAAALIEEQEPRLAEARERLAQLGPKPADGAPPEAEEARRQREEVTKQVSEAAARVSALRLLITRADQIGDRITERRRQLFTAELLDRSTSMLAPQFWLNLINAGPRLGWTTQSLLEDWWRHLTRNVGPAALAAAAGLAIGAGVVLFLLYRALRRRGLYQAPSDVPASDLARALAALRVTGERALVTPLIVGAFLAIAVTFDLTPPRAQPLITAIISATLIVSVTRGVMQGVLAPGAPAYRLFPLSDRMAEAVYDGARQAAWAIALGLVLLAAARIVVAPLAVTMLITGATALALVFVAVRFLLATAPKAADLDGDPAASLNAYGWLRPALWLLALLVLVALAGGYVALASFAASRVAAAVVIATATVLVLGLVDTLIGDWFGEASPRGRSLSASLGLKPQRLELIGALIAGLLRVVVLIASALIVFGPWGFGGVGAAIDDAVVNLRFTELRSFAFSLLAAAVVLVIGFVLVRGVLRWFRVEVLPRSGLDAGLQNSVSTIFGYAGVALVIGLGLRQLGLDLSNLAIVAGALSVGIGFGLQSIVSNFVSGLILLAERPIRVGDQINVRGEEGHVKKISVRSTEIETFERATVIVPNSELITGVVKNWTHSNTQGRIVVPVRVAYDSDPEVVRGELLAAALDMERVLKAPPPRVFLMRFGDAGLEFELRCIVDDVDYSLSTKSELHMAILRRFRERSVIIAPPEQRVQTPWPEGREPAPPPPAPTMLEPRRG